MFTEEAILSAARNMLTGAVNEYLAELEIKAPLVEFGPNLAPGYLGRESVTPLLKLETGERSEKDRIVRLDVYVFSVTFYSPEREGELLSYAFGAALEKALEDDPTMGGVVDRAALAAKSYKEPSHRGTGEDWTAVFKIRLTIEGIG
ncbi:hypothetical protein AGMMS49587_15260 [Spirochaetia bacterium]|nr:hypothetical protein AGMMS49587_15260 [Spirochaetia bacterium]